MIQLNTESTIKDIKTGAYPPHPEAEERVRQLIRLFEGQIGMESVRSVYWTGDHEGIVIKSTNSSDIIGFRLILLRKMREVWSMMDPIYESDLWQELIDERVSDPRVRRWAASVIWWDRTSDKEAELKTQEHKDRWAEFGKRNAEPFKPTLREILRYGSKWMTEAEKDSIKRMEIRSQKNPEGNFAMRWSMIKEPRRRSKTIRAIEEWEDGLLDRAFKAIGYKRPVRPAGKKELVEK